MEGLGSPCPSFAADGSSGDYFERYRCVYLHQVSSTFLAVKIDPSRSHTHCKDFAAGDDNADLGDVQTLRNIGSLIFHHLWILAAAAHQNATELDSRASHNLLADIKHQEAHAVHRTLRLERP